MNSLFTLQGKKAIVTGGMKGLGKAMTRALCSAGVRVVVIDILKQQEKYEENRDTSFIRANLIDRVERRKAFKSAIDELGTLDILVNNAGMQRRAKAEDFKIDDWDRIVELNLTSVFELCQLAAKIMIAKRYGKIINIASMLSFFGGITVPAYAASKGGIVQLTKALSNEWAEKGINVSAIAPGFMITDLNRAIINDKVRYQQILSRIPAGRWGEPKDVIGALLFLASHASDYVNGIVLPVDGGYLAK